MRTQSMACFAVAIILQLTGGAHALTTSFSQLDWLADATTYVAPMSEYGELSLLFDPSDLALLAPHGTGYIGYVNLATTVADGATNDWSVRNIPMYFDSAGSLTDRLADTFWFDLGTTRGLTRINSLDYRLSISVSPLTAAPTGAMTSISVTAQDVLFGGEAGTLSDGTTFEGGAGVAPPAISPATTLAAFGVALGDSGKISIKPKDVADVAEKVDGCAPGAATRSLKYLAQTNDGLTITDDTATLYNALYDNMKTNVDKKGTKIHPDFKDGKDKYSKHLVGGHGDGPIKTVTGVRDINQVIEALKSGADVEMGIYWGKNAAGESCGGHCVFVTQVDTYVDAEGKLTGYKVTYIDDSAQGKGAFDDGTNNKQHHLIFDKDGKLFGPGVGIGAGLNDFRIETVVPIPEPASAALLLLVAPFLRRPAARGS